MTTGGVGNRRLGVPPARRGAMRRESWVHVVAPAVVRDGLLSPPAARAARGGAAAGCRLKRLQLPQDIADAVGLPAFLLSDEAACDLLAMRRKTWTLVALWHPPTCSDERSDGRSRGRPTGGDPAAAVGGAAQPQFPAARDRVTGSVAAASIAATPEVRLPRSGAGLSCGMNVSNVPTCLDWVLSDRTGFDALRVGGS